MAAVSNVWGATVGGVRGRAPRGTAAGLRTLAWVLVLVAALACSTGGAAATVDGVAISHEALEQLHPGRSEVDADDRASSLLLLIVHHLLVRSAEEEFGFSVPRDAQHDAFTARIAGYGNDLEAALESRGVTRKRVLLEARLDVIRQELERRLVLAGGDDVDMDAAYRTFVSVNSRVCLSALRVSDESIVAAVEDLVSTGADLEGVEESYPDRVERLHLDCGNPAELGPGLSSVALDAEVGEVHVVQKERGVVVAVVDQRDAPELDDVRDEVLQIATESQGPRLFTAWAADLLRGAEVDVADSIGEWAPTAGTNGIPTVVVHGQ